MWNTIESMVTTTVTLTEAFRGRTNSSANYVTAQISELESAWPGLIRFLPAHFAAAEHLRSEQPELANLIETRALNAMNLLRVTKPQQLTDRRGPSYAKSSFLRTTTGIK
jgi:hypothetical protein